MYADESPARERKDKDDDEDTVMNGVTNPAESEDLYPYLRKNPVAQSVSGETFEQLRLEYDHGNTKPKKVPIDNKVDKKAVKKANAEYKVAKKPTTEKKVDKKAPRKEGPESESGPEPEPEPEPERPTTGNHALLQKPNLKLPSSIFEAEDDRSYDRTWMNKYNIPTIEVYGFTSGMKLDQLMCHGVLKVGDQLQVQFKEGPMRTHEAYDDDDTAHGTVN